MQPTSSLHSLPAEEAVPAWGLPGVGDWLKDLPVLVLGLGDSGLAMARWCARCGAQVTVWDSREHTAGDAALAAEWPTVRLHLDWQLERPR